MPSGSAFSRSSASSALTVSGTTIGWRSAAASERSPPPRIRSSRSFACTTPTTLSTAPSQTTKRECGEAFRVATISFAGSVRSIQIELGARRHQGAHRLVGEPQHAFDHVALLGFQHAGLCALGEQGAQLLLGDRLGGEAGQAEQVQHQRRRAAEQPHRRGGEPRGPEDRPGQRGGQRLRPAQRELLRHQLAQHQGEIGGHHHHQRQRQRRGDAHRQGEPPQPPLHLRGHLGAAEHADEHADQGHAHLHRGQEALRVLGQPACARRAAHVLAFQHREAGTAGRNQGELAHREHAVDPDQQQQNDTLDREFHHSVRSGRRNTGPAPVARCAVSIASARGRNPPCPSRAKSPWSPAAR